MTTQLELYNAALDHLGQRRLLNLSDEGQALRALNGVWNSGAYIDRMLGQGHWNFATRTVELTYSPSVEPPFGFQYAFDKPEDWIKTSAMACDPHFNTLLAYNDEAAYWFADQDTIWVKYVSNDNQYGGDLSLWPQSFCDFVEADLAWRASMPISNDKQLRNDMWTLRKRLRAEARSIDGANEAVQYPPAGTWSRSRQGNRGGYYGRRGWR